MSTIEDFVYNVSELRVQQATNVWRFEARDLWLRGGRHQLSLGALGNRNINQGFFLVDNVQFENSSGIAINIHGGTPYTKLVVRGC